VLRNRARLSWLRFRFQVSSSYFPSFGSDSGTSSLHNCKLILKEYFFQSFLVVLVPERVPYIIVSKFKRKFLSIISFETGWKQFDIIEKITVPVLIAAK
jgi:hypothetical protein